jgi:hypothetical protein
MRKPVHLDCVPVLVARVERARRDPLRLDPGVGALVEQGGQRDAEHAARYQPATEL